jgi:hypothetical protein
VPREEAGEAHRPEPAPGGTGEQDGAHTDA